MKSWLTAVAMLLAGASGATEYFVDDDNYGKAGMDGSTTNLAFGTIQEGVAVATEAGDIVTILPGIYDQGENYDTTTKCSNRVVITHNKIILRGTPGHRDDTVILGKHATGGGIGDDAVRCVFVGWGGRGSIIQGLTLKSGASRAKDSGSGTDFSWMAGGLFDYSGEVWATDCRFEACRAWRGGAIFRGNVHRCLFVANEAESDACVGYQLISASHSVFMNHSEHSLFYYSNPSRVFLNCDFIGNEKSFFYTGCTGAELYNCLAIGNSGDLAFSTGTGNVPYVTNLVNYVTDKTDAGTYRKEDSHCQFGQDSYQFMAPMADDFRLVEGAVAVTAGDARYLSKITLPSEIENRDYAGNLLDPTAATFAVGAVQATAKPASGRLQLTGWHGVFQDESGKPLLSGYAFYDTWPTQIVVKPVVPEGKVWGVSAIGASSLYRFPDLNGQMVLMPPPPWESNSQEYKVLKAANVLKADPTGANGAYATLQAAVDAAPETGYTLIEAAAGEYATGGAVMKGLMSRVAISNRLVRLVGQGAGQSFIVGAPDPNDVQTGIGPEAVRCVAFGSSTLSVVQGFTLTGGHSNAGSTGMGAGACGTDRAKNFLLDVELSCLTGGTSTCGCNLTIHRAKVHDIWVNETNVFGVEVCGSAVLGYRWHQVGKKSWSATLIGGEATYWCNSTLLGESDQNLIRPYLNTSLVIVHTSAETFVNRDRYRNEGSFFYNTQQPQEYNAPFLYLAGQDPDFVMRTEHDYRLSTASPAVDAFDATVCCSNFWQYMAGDLNGKPLRINAGKMTPGCLQAEIVPVTKLTVTQPSVGGVVMEGAEYGVNRLVPGDTVKLAAVLTRPFDGFRVNGTIEDENVTNLVFNIDDSAQTLAVEPVYGKTWHVDAVNGDDNRSGATVADAKLRLAAAFTNQYLQVADTVLAEDGVYDSGEMATPTANATVNYRVVINLAQVNLISRNGPEKTVIVGRSGSGDDGLGEGALHGVYLRSKSKLIGFTVTGARTKTYDEVQDWNDDTCHGAIRGESSTYSLVENCIVSNNVSQRYAAGSHVCFVRTRILDNRSTVRGPAGSDNRYLGCYINGNNGSCLLNGPISVENTTIGPDVQSGNDYVYVSPDKFRAVNSLFLWSNVCGGTKDGERYVNNMSNCVFLAGSVKGANSNLVDCVEVASLDQLQVDAIGRPIVGKNAAIDAAAAAFYDASVCGETDLDGGQRIYNGKLDAGCYEANWCPRYARDLGPGVTVSAASPDVVEAVIDGWRVVRIDSGTLSAAWNRVGEPTVAHVQVVGSGTLAVKRGTATVATVTADQGKVAVPLVASSESLPIDFVFSPDETSAYAVVSELGVRGSLLLFK